MALGLLSPTRLDVARVIEENLSAHSLHFGRLPGADCYDGPEVKWVYTGHPGLGGINRIFDAHLTYNEIERVVPRTLKPFQEAKAAVIWECGPSTRPTDLGRYLRAQGMENLPPWTGMGLSMEALPDYCSPPSGVTFETVRTVEALEAWIGVINDAIGVNSSASARQAFRRTFLELGFGSHLPWRYYLGWLNGQPVSTSLLYSTGEVAGLYWVVTAPEVRRRGIATALTWHALREARERGQTLAVLQATDLGLGIYRKLGFEEHCQIDIYRWKPDRREIKMKKVSDLKLSPGERVFVDSLKEGVARLLIGENGERMESVPADQLPHAGRKEGAYLSVDPRGALQHDPDEEKEASNETATLMNDVFGSPPPE